MGLPLSDGLLGEARRTDVPDERIATLQGPQNGDIVLVTVDRHDVHPTLGRPHLSPADSGGVRVGLDEVECTLYPLGELVIGGMKCLQSIARGGGHMQCHFEDITPSGHPG